MPLKHSTETALVAILALAMAITGVVVGVLSFVVSSGFLWIAAFLAAIAYPLALYPHFRDRRADYEFRLLHFAPAALLLLWLLLTVLVSYVPWLAFIPQVLFYGWALPLVLAGFGLLAWFCLLVVRQWPKRLALLGLVFLPFLGLGLFGERNDWNRQIASLFPSSGTGGSVAVSSSSSRPAIAVGSASSKPPSLPHAGGGLELFALIVPAATCAAMQVRARRRS